MEKIEFTPRVPQQVYNPGQAQIQLEQPYPVHHPVQRMPRDYIALSFITLLCCCFPIGIFALLQSIKARAASRDGNFGAAEQASYSARVLNIIGIILGTVIIIVLVIVVAILIDNGDCRKTGSRSYECF